MPLFVRPFARDYPVGNFFDHDKPVDNDTNGYVLTLCGARDRTQVDGHAGYDWRMPEGTRLSAAADGIIFFAGLEPPHYCAPLNRTVQALLVEIEHPRAVRGVVHQRLRAPVASRRRAGRQLVTTSTFLIAHSDKAGHDSPVGTLLNICERPSSGSR